MVHAHNLKVEVRAHSLPGELQAVVASANDSNTSVELDVHGRWQREAY
jgi:hypothetical protein